MVHSFGMMGPVTFGRFYFKWGFFSWGPTTRPCTLSPWPKISGGSRAEPFPHGSSKAWAWLRAWAFGQFWPQLGCCFEKDTQATSMVNSQYPKGLSGVQHINHMNIILSALLFIYSPKDPSSMSQLYHIRGLRTPWARQCNFLPHECLTEKGYVKLTSIYGDTSGNWWSSKGFVGNVDNIGHLSSKLSRKFMFDLANVWA